MTVWQLRTRTLRFDDGPLVMGIVNATPDSFSDGGTNFEVDRAVETALRMEDAGAAIIDIGGESTRPYSDAVDADEERRRIEPIFESLQPRVSCALSIDTSKASVARVAIAHGAEIINDVTGLEGDPEMPALAHASGAGICVMHMQGTPQTMQDAPHYDNVVEEIFDYLAQRKAACLAAGITNEKICLDPGIGFGKSHEHNIQLLQSVNRFLSLDTPILVGHSRKGFVKKLVGSDDLALRDAGTLGVSMHLASQGIHVLRVHNVEQTMAALKLFKACTSDHGAG